VVAPLNEIAQAVDRGATTETHIAAPDYAPDVIARMASSLNASLRTVHEAESQAISASAAKGEFLARMSHEIRTPMNGVMGMLEALLNTKIEPEQADYLRTAYTSADRLLVLINDILDYSKIEAGKLNIEKIDFDLPQLIAHTVSLWSRRAEEKGVALVASVDPAVPQWVTGDPTRVGQVLTNLTSNALKFTERGSVSIHIDAERMDGDVAALRFCVADTGIGIPAAAQATLFTAFMQADGSTSRRYGGTGLGLAICQQLVHLMGGGAIRVTSEPGNGSRFEFELEFAIATPVQHTATISAAPSLNTSLAAHGRVLIVDDNDTNRKVAQVVLTRLGVEFDTANDGSEAFDRIKLTRYALVLMDCHMPVVDGFEAAALIRRWEQEQNLPRLPIVAASASAFAEDREKCFAAGMDDFLPKPLTLASVGATLGRWMEMAVVVPTNLASASSEAVANEVSDLFDHAQLNEMRMLIGAGFVDMVRQLNANSVEAFDAMNEAAAAGDAEALRAAAHKFKGSLGTVGAKAAADAAWLIELQGRDGKVAGAHENIARLANTYRRTRAHLRKLTLASAAEAAEERARASG
jgi:signal transduction histidine kinase/DNA-binding NarL/FixJ family response regulator